MTKLRIAILTHSTNPRGGVVHALELGDALMRLGHEAVVHAPDARGHGFFRETLCGTLGIPASQFGGSTKDLVVTRIGDYIRHFQIPAHRRFDIFHAQDGISANALATLKNLGLVQVFARTVHHVDHFDDAELMALQANAITSADSLFVVSRTWQDYVQRNFGKQSRIIGNGVDRARFSPAHDGHETGLRQRLGLAEGPVFLSIGGIEERKNTLRILQAFVKVRQTHPTAKLLIAGGASVLDHRHYQAQFAAALACAGLLQGAVRNADAIPQADMPALYRIADTLVFPSVKEGFGLVVLEAMASGMPVVVSKIAPFTEYLGENDVAWCDPMDTDSIAEAMRTTLETQVRHALIKNGHAVAARHDWKHTASTLLAAYAEIRELQHA